MRWPTLLFDLDGTLTDARPGIVACIRHAVEGMGRPCPDDDALAAFIGPPLRGTFATLLQTTDRDRIEAAMAFPEMLAAVGGRAQAAFVATSKPTMYAERIMRHFDLARHFAGVYGTELDARLDDKAVLLARLMECEGIARGAAVMSASCGRPAPPCSAPSLARLPPASRDDERRHGRAGVARA